MRLGCEVSKPFLTALRKPLSASSLLVGGCPNAFRVVMRRRRANSSKSALTSDQFICRGSGQKVRPLARSCVSSCVSVMLDKLITELGSRDVVVLYLESRLVFMRRIRFRLSFTVSKFGQT